MSAAWQFRNSWNSEVHCNLRNEQIIYSHRALRFPSQKQSESTKLGMSTMRPVSDSNFPMFVLLFHSPKQLAWKFSDLWTSIHVQEADHRLFHSLDVSQSGERTKKQRRWWFWGRGRTGWIFEDTEEEGNKSPRVALEWPGYQNQDKTNKKNLHGSSITSCQTRQGQIRTLHVSFPIHLPLQYSYLLKNTHITCRHKHPTNTKSCKVLFSPLSYRWETGTELNWARSCSHQVSELGLELIQSDSRVCALHTPATLTLPRFLCRPLGYELYSYLCHYYDASLTQAFVSMK